MLALLFVQIHFHIFLTDFLKVYMDFLPTLYIISYYNSLILAYTIQNSIIPLGTKIVWNSAHIFPIVVWLIYVPGVHFCSCARRRCIIGWIRILWFEFQPLRLICFHILKFWVRKNFDDTDVLIHKILWTISVMLFWMKTETSLARITNMIALMITKIYRSITTKAFKYSE